MFIINRLGIISLSQRIDNPAGKKQFWKIMDNEWRFRIYCMVEFYMKIKNGTFQNRNITSLEVIHISLIMTTRWKKLI